MQNIEEIYNKYAEILYKYVFCLTGDEDITEEIIQETFVVAIKDINKFRGDCKISTWLCQISKYIWYKRLKNTKDKKEVSIDTIKNPIFIEDSIEEQICNKEQQFEILKKIQKLDEETKNVMYLRLLGNFTYNEIAEIMDKTTTWARVVYFRGKKKIKENLKPDA